MPSKFSSPNLGKAAHKEIETQRRSAVCLKLHSWVIPSKPRYRHHLSCKRDLISESGLGVNPRARYTACTRCSPLPLPRPHPGVFNSRQEKGCKELLAICFLRRLHTGTQGSRNNMIPTGSQLCRTSSTLNRCLWSLQYFPLSELKEQ